MALFQNTVWNSHPGTSLASENSILELRLTGCKQVCSINCQEVDLWRAKVTGESWRGKNSSVLLIPELSLAVKPAAAKACCLLGCKHLGFCHAWLPSQLKILPQGSPPAAVRQSRQLNELLSILRLHLLVVEVRRGLLSWLMSRTHQENQPQNLLSWMLPKLDLGILGLMVHVWSAVFASEGKAFCWEHRCKCCWVVNLVWF